MTPDLYLDLYHERYGPEFYGTGQAATSAVVAEGITRATAATAGTFIDPSRAETDFSGNDGRTS